MKNDIYADYSPQIRYTINNNYHSIRYHYITLFENRYYDYSRLFNFINTDLNIFTDLLNTFYHGNFSPSLEKKDIFSKISIFLHNLFGASTFQSTMDFLLNDYAEYCFRCYYSHNNSNSQNFYIQQFLEFATFLLELHDYYKHEDQSMIILDDTTYNFNNNCIYYSKQLFVDYCHTIITNLFSKESPISITSENKPYTLNLIKTTILKLFLPTINGNNAFRLSKLTQQNKAELILQSNNLTSLSLPPVLRISNYSCLFMLDNLYKNNIHNDTGFIPLDTTTKCYLLDRIECILLIDLQNYIKTTYYTKKCPNPTCNRIFYTKKPHSFYCNSQCSKQHLQNVQMNCEIWHKCIKIEKRINERVRRHPKQSQLYSKINTSTILSEYLDGKYDFDAAYSKLEELETRITTIQNEQHKEMLEKNGSIINNF